MVSRLPTSNRAPQLIVNRLSLCLPRTYHTKLRAVDIEEVVDDFEFMELGTIEISDDHAKQYMGEYCCELTALYRCGQSVHENEYQAGLWMLTGCWKPPVHRAPIRSAKLGSLHILRISAGDVASSASADF